MQSLSSEARRFVELEESAREAVDPEVCIASAQEALGMVNSLTPWPFTGWNRRFVKGVLLASLGRAYAELRASDPSQFSAPELKALDAASKILVRADGDAWYQTVLLRAQATMMQHGTDTMSAVEAAAELLQGEWKAFDLPKSHPLYATILLRLSSLCSKTKGSRYDRSEQAPRLIEEAYQFVDKRNEPLLFSQLVVTEASCLLDSKTNLSIQESRSTTEKLRECVILLDRQTSPYEWGIVQATLAMVLTEENCLPGTFNRSLDQAIAASDLALEAFQSIGSYAEFEIARCHLNRVALFGRKAAVAQGGKFEHLARQSASQALSFFSEEQYPAQYACIVNNLALLRGQSSIDRLNNTEDYEKQLSKLNADTDPGLWRAVAYNMAAALINQPLSPKKANDVEKAIELLSDILRHFRDNDLNTKSVLANAYALRSKGKTWENQENAVALFEECLADPSILETPSSYANICGNLAQSLLERQKGNQADDIERALSLTEDALVILSRHDHPERHAVLLERLALASSRRPRGDKKANLREALSAYGNARQIREMLGGSPIPASVDERSVASQLELKPPPGSQSENGDHGERSQEFINGIREQLSAMDRQKQTTECIQGHVYLAQVLLQVSLAKDGSEMPEFLSALVKQFEEAVRELDSADSLVSAFNLDPGKFAIAVTRVKALHLIYLMSILRDTPSQRMSEFNSFKSFPHSEEHRSRLKQLVEIQSEVLTEYPESVSPRRFLHECLRLAEFYVEQRSWRNVVSILQSAMQTGRRLLGDLEIAEAEMGAIVHDLQQCTNQLPFALALVKDDREAIVAADSGRALMIAKMVSLRGLDMEVDVKKRLTEISDLIAREERKLVSPCLVDRETPLLEIKKLRREYKECFSGANVVVDTPWETIAMKLEGVLQDNEALFVPHVTSIGGMATLVIKAESGLRISSFEIGGKQSLASIAEDSRSYRSSILASGSGTNGRKHFEKLQGTLSEHLLQPLMKLLESEEDYSRIDHLIVMSCDALSSVPVFPAIGRDLNSAMLYSVSFCPNVKTGNRCQLGNARRLQASGLGVIENPARRDERYLKLAQVESEVVSSFFAKKTALRRSEATLSATIDCLRGSEVWHFCCHGMYNQSAPLESGLLLAGDDVLRAKDLLSRYDLEPPELVVLSACETGLVDRNVPTEFTGMIGAMLQLGAKGIVGSMWPVSDLATCLLFSRFYSILSEGDCAPWKALHQAQMWLREADQSRLQSCVESWRAEGRLSSSSVARLRRAFMDQRDPTPFGDPYYWAAFVYHGL